MSPILKYGGKGSNKLFVYDTKKEEVDRRQPLL